MIANLRLARADSGKDLLAAVLATRERLQGHYAFAVLCGDGGAGNGHREIVAARQGPPLVLGVGDGEQFLASDPTALVNYTKRVVYLENGDIARIERADRKSTTARQNPCSARPPALVGPGQAERAATSTTCQGDPRASAGLSEDLLGGWTSKRGVVGWGARHRARGWQGQASVLACAVLHQPGRHFLIEGLRG